MKMDLPQAVLARWQRRQAREGRINADTSELCRSEIEKLRGQRPSIDRDASLALWLEHTTRNSSGRRDALEEAASLLTRATAIAERRDQYDGLDDLRRWRRRVCYLRDCATARAPKPAATEAVPCLGADASAAAVAAFLARGEPVLVEGGADALSSMRASP